MIEVLRSIARKPVASCQLSVASFAPSSGVVRYRGRLPFPTMQSQRWPVFLREKTGSGVQDFGGTARTVFSRIGKAMLPFWDRLVSVTGVFREAVENESAAPTLGPSLLEIQAMVLLH